MDTPRIDKMGISQGVTLAVMALCLAACKTTTTPLRSDIQYPDERMNVRATDSDVQPNADTLYALAQLLEAREDDAGAVVVYETLMRNYERYLSAYTDLAMILIRRNRLDLAQQVLQEGISVEENDPYLHNNLGVVHVLQAQYESALTQFERAGTLRPGDRRYRANQALALGLLGRFDEALDRYEGVMSAHDARYNLKVIQSMLAARRESNAETAARMRELLGLDTVPTSGQTEDESSQEPVVVEERPWDTPIIAADDNAQSSAGRVAVVETSPPETSAPSPDAGAVAAARALEPESVKPEPDAAPKTSVAMVRAPQAPRGVSTIGPATASEPSNSTPGLDSPVQLEPLRDDVQDGEAPPVPVDDAEAALDPTESDPSELVSASGLTGYTIQVAAFDAGSQRRSERYKSRIEKTTDYEVLLITTGDANVIRACVGTYPDEASANAAKRELEKVEQFAGCFVKALSEE